MIKKRSLLTLGLLIPTTGITQELISENINISNRAFSFVLPEGACSLRFGKELRLANVLQNFDPISNNSIRFISCGERRKVLEEGNWPTFDGSVEILPLESITNRMFVDMTMRSRFFQILVRNFTGQATYNPQDIPELPNVILNRLESLWPRFIESVESRNNEANYQKEMFFVTKFGRTWMVGIKKRKEQVIASVEGFSAKEVLRRVSWNGAFQGPKTFELAMKDLLPPLTAMD